MDHTKVCQCHDLAIIHLLTYSSGAWLVLPLYMIYVYSLEIYEGLLTATDKRVKAT